MANAALVKELYRFEGHTSDVDSISFSPDGKFLASASSGDGTVRVWDMNSSKQTFSVNAMNNRGVVYASNGRVIIDYPLWQDKSSSLQVWDTRTQQQTGQLSGPLGELVRNSDGTMFSVGCEVVWNSNSLQKVSQFTPLEPTSDSVRQKGCVYEPKGKLLAYLVRGDKLELWDPSSQSRITSLPIANGYSYTTSNISISQDESLIAVGWLAAYGVEGATRIWRMSDWQLVAEFRSGNADRLAFNRDGSLLAIASDRWIQLWDVTGKRKITTLSELSHAARTLEFSPDGRFLVTGDEPVIRIWGIP